MKNKKLTIVFIVLLVIASFSVGAVVGGKVSGKVQNNKDYKALDEMVLSLNDKYSAWQDLANEQKEMDDAKGAEYYTHTISSSTIGKLTEMGRGDEVSEYATCVGVDEYGRDLYVKCTKEEYDAYQDLTDQISDKRSDYYESFQEVSAEVGKYNATHKDKYTLESSGGYCYLIPAVNTTES